MGQESTEKAASATEARFTPGPWHVGGDSDAIWVSPPSEDDSVICNIIARGKELTEEDEGNARLIAQSPDLLASAKATLDCLQLIALDLASVGIAIKSLPNASLYCGIGARLVDAIAKAEGRAK